MGLSAERVLANSNPSGRRRPRPTNGQLLEFLRLVRTPATNCAGFHACGLYHLQPASFEFPAAGSRPPATNCSGSLRLVFTTINMGSFLAGRTTCNQLLGFLAAGRTPVASPEFPTSWSRTTTTANSGFPAAGRD